MYTITDIKFALHLQVNDVFAIPVHFTARNRFPSSATLSAKREPEVCEKARSDSNGGCRSRMKEIYDSDDSLHTEASGTAQTGAQAILEKSYKVRRAFKCVGVFVSCVACLRISPLWISHNSRSNTFNYYVRLVPSFAAINGPQGL